MISRRLSASPSRSSFPAAPSSPERPCPRGSRAQTGRAFPIEHFVALEILDLEGAEAVPDGFSRSTSAAARLRIWLISALGRLANLPPHIALGGLGLESARSASSFSARSSTSLSRRFSMSLRSTSICPSRRRGSRQEAGSRSRRARGRGRRGRCAAEGSRGGQRRDEPDPQAGQRRGRSAERRLGPLAHPPRSRISSRGSTLSGHARPGSGSISAGAWALGPSRSGWKASTSKVRR